MPRAVRGTRSALLDAALDAFARLGFAGASIRAITREVGVRESAFYAHFPSKQAAYDELFAEAGPPAAARTLEALAAATPAEFLPEFALTVIDAWSLPRARKFAAMTMRDAFDNEARGWRTMRTSIDGFLQLLVKRFKRWQAEGLVRGDVPAEVLAFEFIGPIAMSRFLFFNIAAGKADATFGRKLIADHAATFSTLIEPQVRKRGRK